MAAASIATTRDRKVGKGSASDNTAGIPIPSPPFLRVGIVHPGSLSRFLQESMAPKYWWSCSRRWESLFRVLLTGWCHGHLARKGDHGRDGCSRRSATGILPKPVIAKTCPGVLDPDGHGTRPEGQATPILPKTPRITQGAPEKIRVKPFKII